MGFFDAFTGKAQRQRIDQAHEASKGMMSDAYGKAQGAYGQADSYYQPYAQQGQQANALYGDAMGLGGAGGGQRALSAYQGAMNPYLQHQQDGAENALMRSMAARGMSASGPALLAASRARQDIGYQDYNNWMGRLGGMQQQGLGVAGARAGLQQGLGQMHMGYGQTMAGNEISYGNAMAQADGIGWNNLFRMGEIAAKAASGASGGGAR
jgi:hypothetical protein